MTPQALTAHLHAQIPLTAAMAIRVLACDRSRIEIHAPLAPNRNHRGHGFGGSLATLGIVCGWALVDHALRSEGLEAAVAIRHSDCDFRTAVASDFTAVARLPDAAWPRFLDTLRRHRRAAVDVETEIAAVPAGPALVRHRGRYAAHIETVRAL